MILNKKKSCFVLERLNWVSVKETYQVGLANFCRFLSLTVEKTSSTGKRPIDSPSWWRATGNSTLLCRINHVWLPWCTFCRVFGDLGEENNAARNLVRCKAFDDKCNAFVHKIRSLYPSPRYWNPSHHRRRS